MRPYKNPKCSPLVEQVVLSNLKQSKAVVQKAEQRVEDMKKTVQRAQELIAHRAKSRRH